MPENTNDPALGGEEGARWSGSEPHLSDHVAVVKHLEAMRYWRTRADATRDIVKFGRAAVPGLLEALYDQNVGVRLHAVEALRQVADWRGIEGLIGALWDEHALVRQSAAVALGELADARAIEGLVRLLEDAEVWVRRDAALALGAIGGLHPESAPLIVPNLLDVSSGSSIVRSAATAALRRMGQAAIPALREGLHAPRWITRRVAAAALADIGQAAVPTLEQALSSTDTGVQRVAAWALDRVTVA